MENLTLTTKGENKICLDSEYIIDEIFEKYNSIQNSVKKELQFIKSDIDSLDIKTKKLEKSNFILVEEYNQRLVSSFAEILINYIENKDLVSFKNLINEFEYPIDEFLINTKVSKNKIIK